MKTTGVLFYSLFSEYEISVAISVLKQGNHPITTIGIEPGPIKGESDLTCLPEKTILDTDISTLDSLLLPGCMDISTLFDNKDIIEFIQSCSRNQNFKIGAISSSPYLLAKAGLLENRKFTVGLSYEQRRSIGLFNESLHSNDLVVQDRNIVTARGRGFIEFGIRFGNLLELEFDPQWYKG